MQHKSGCEENFVSKEEKKIAKKVAHKEKTKENGGALKKKGMQYCVCVKEERAFVVWPNLGLWGFGWWPLFERKGKKSARTKKKSETKEDERSSI